MTITKTVIGVDVGSGSVRAGIFDLNGSLLSHATEKITTTRRSGSRVEQSSQEILMLAYMNQEAFEKTLATGLMHYYSRSRKKLWLKGETSGHFQQLRSLAVDCDADTLIADIYQIGPACHTGNHSCFYRQIDEL